MPSARAFPPMRPRATAAAFLPSDFGRRGVIRNLACRDLGDQDGVAVHVGVALFAFWSSWHSGTTYRCLALSILQWRGQAMSITISYDITAADNNERNYIRSMFERFCWTRLGGSVFRYDWKDDTGQEDWLNDVVPALMVFRSYCLAKNIEVKFFTLDASSVTRLDTTDPGAIVGTDLEKGDKKRFCTPTNAQSSESRIRRAITSMVDIFVTQEQEDDD